jgi:hypothetical protein
MWILAGVLAAGIFGFPVVPVLVFGAIAMCGLAFYLTRDGRLLRIGLGAVTVLANQVLVKVFFKDPADIPGWASWMASDTTVVAVSCIAIALAMFYGVLGPVRDLPLTLDGVLKTVKDAEQREHHQADTPETEGKRALKEVDNALGFAHRQLQNGRPIVVACAIGLVVVILYAVLHG